MTARSQNAPRSGSETRDIADESIYLDDLILFYNSWKTFWQTWLQEHLQGKKLPRRAEQMVLQALHGPEARIPQAHKACWHSLQASCHEILHQLHIHSEEASKNCPIPEFVPVIGAASALEQQCFEEIVAFSKNLGEIDILTNLPNRRRMEQDLVREQALVDRGANGFIAMIDVDHFKTLNDTYGHPAGDAILREIARRLRAALRHYDGLYRYGGEEFLAIFPGLGTECALLAAQRLCRTVAADPFQTVDGHLLTITLSIGITALAHHMSPAERMAIADVALYRAKQGGRNQVRLIP
ncbi:GGDEF domain-containing protein [Acidithiobacillus sp.]|uniref:GGDEF domain-containing protein n=1 Tax=Acidithiobacillus sp. TaxID=1872118 RepID=UPI0025B8F049|nr:GGDEF domain-containing protein [Acidithiobacillus sp.]MCK9187623.1 GGDEF domain-containing protein [Acidithiobacillus sp.]MCK9358513.1 GGDEF domain-containing protein [Acidithiobacillus sp.]